MPEPLQPAITLAALAHPRAEVAADILVLMQSAHAQEAQWLNRRSQTPPPRALQDIQASGHFHLGALQGDRLVGLLVIAPDEEPGQLSINTLVVHPRAQRQGVGRSLVQDALQRAPGVAFAVSAASANAAAMGLYSGLGFVPYRQGLMATTQ